MCGRIRMDSFKCAPSKEQKIFIQTNTEHILINLNQLTKSILLELVKRKSIIFHHNNVRLHVSFGGHTKMISTWLRSFYSSNTFPKILNLCITIYSGHYRFLTKSFDSIEDCKKASRRVLCWECSERLGLWNSAIWQ